MIAQIWYLHIHDTWQRYQYHIYVTGGGEASSYDIDHEYLFKADMSALRAGNSLKYKIKLTSYYIDEYQNQVDSKPDEHYVTLTYVPLFDLR